MKQSLGRYGSTIKSKYKSLSPIGRMRLKGGLAIALLMGFGLIVTTQIMGATSDITGTVFQDFNGNGKRDNVGGATLSQAVDRGLAGVTVRAFAEDGSLCDTKASAADGSYALSVGNCAGTKFRVEFSGLPAGFNSTQVGDDSRTSVRFVAAGGTASFGAYRPGDFCQNNPLLVTSCMRSGIYNGNEADEVGIFGFAFNASGTQAPALKMGRHDQVGSTYGHVYRPATKTVYSSAYMKRHSDFGPGGTGAIYKSVIPSSGTGTLTPSLATTVPNSGEDPHPVSNNICGEGSNNSGPFTDNCWSHDKDSFAVTTKRSLGSMALAPDYTNPANDALLVVNLNDRQLYKVSNLDGSPVSTGYGLPLGLPNNGSKALPSGSAVGQHQGCAQSDVRPFSVNVYQGTGYAGFVCSAESSRNAANLRAYIYTFDVNSMVFASAPMMEFPLNYGRSCAYGTNGNCTGRATWIPWVSDFNDALTNRNVGTASDGGRSAVGPQPILSDISFGENGSLTIGLRDRYDDQMAYQGESTQYGQTQRYIPETAGDLLRACLVNGSYVLESGGTCDGKGPGSGGVKAVASGLPQGIGGYEFYNNDYFADTNQENVLMYDETSNGAVAEVPGFTSFASTAKSPLNGKSLGMYSGGIRHYSSETGARTNAYRLYQNIVGTSYIKANALGDINVICDSAPLEIGNRVWRDANGNGVQDAAEPGIPGVTVTLRDTAGNTIATVLTDGEGNYLFSSRTQNADGQVVTSTPNQRYGLTGLKPNTNGYRLALQSAADYADPARLQGLGLTTADATTANGNDQNDSDAYKQTAAAELSASNPAIINVNTGTPGANNHTHDFGLAELGAIGNFVWQDSNKDGRVNGGEATQGINGVTVGLYAGSADTNNDGSVSGAELAAATPVATKVTANDTRSGATLGRAGYYQFDNLVKGSYFVAVSAANFASGQALQQLTEVPVPAGVGDTQDDNTNHGAVPAGGSLNANGVVSAKITIEPNTEPTTSSAKPDDDANDSSDTTIDFGFWHPYSLGNRVWIDKNNSATIDAADGATPGVAGVQVNLLASNGSFIRKTDTTANGYYRFDGLSAGTYIVEIPSQNFAQGGPLYNSPVSSVGAGQEADPDSNGDSNDNGINPQDLRQAVRSGTITLGPGAVEPTGENDLSGGQGTDDAFANMTLDFGFVGTTSFGDTVFYDIDGDGTQDTIDPGIPNVTVTLVCAGPDNNFATSIDNTTATQKTDASGNYLFTGLLPGTCRGTVTTSDVPGATLTTPGSFTSPVDQDNSFLDADFGFSANGSIGNQVWKEVFNNGTYSLDEGDMPIEGVKIELYRDTNGNNAVDDSDLMIGAKTTDSNGRYQFTGLPTEDNSDANGPGAKYVVRVNGPADKLANLQPSVGPNPGANNNSQPATGYAVTLSQSVPSNQTADFGYHGLAEVGDTVFYDVNADGVQDAEDPVLPGITVTLTYPGPDDDCVAAADNETRVTVTNSNGIYGFKELLGGNYCISIAPPAGTTITTNNQGQKFDLGPTEIDLTRDFGVVGDGTIGNQVYIDYNNNGRYDGGDKGVAGVSLDLYKDLNGNGVVDGGEPVVQTLETNASGQYEFKQLMTGIGEGVDYIVVVTDTNKALDTLTHVPGNGPADNESKNPAGYAVTLTPVENHRPEADFGYKPNPQIVLAPDFWKKQTVDGQDLVYTMTWINLSALNGIVTTFNDPIPVGTTYVDKSLECKANGTSKTSSCTYNANLNRIEWSGTVDADAGNRLPDVAKNAITVTIRVRMAPTTFDVSNQACGTYDENGDGKIDDNDGNTKKCVPSDDIDTPEPDDPNLYHRDPEDAAVVAATGGLLANTGQLIWAAVGAAVVLIGASIGLFAWARRQPKWLKK